MSQQEERDACSTTTRVAVSDPAVEATDLGARLSCARASNVGHPMPSEAVAPTAQAAKAGPLKVAVATWDGPTGIPASLGEPSEYEGLVRRVDRVRGRVLLR